MNYIYHKDLNPKDIKKELTNKWVKCKFDTKEPALLVGISDYVKIKAAYYDYDDYGIWWELDVTHKDIEYENVILCNTDTIEQLYNQKNNIDDEGVKNLESIKEEYVMSDEEVDEVMHDMTLWSAINMIEEALEDESLSDESKSELTNRLKDLLDKTND